VWRDRCILLQQLNLLNHLLAYRVPEAEALARELGESKAFRDFAATARRASRKDSRNLSTHEQAARQIYRNAGARLLVYRFLQFCWRALPSAIRTRVSPPHKARIRRLLRLPRSTGPGA
jgi:hypothetical protein